MKILLIILFSLATLAQTRIIPFSTNPTTAGGAMPSIVYVDRIGDEVNDGDSLQFTHWASIASGQLIIIIHNNEGTADQQWGTGGDTVRQVGWTYIGESTGTNIGANIGAYYKVATGSETGNFASYCLTSSENAGWYIVLDNVDTSDPLNIMGTPIQTVATSVIIPEVTTDAANCLVFGLWAFDGSDWGSITFSNSGWALEDSTYARVNNASTDGCAYGLKEMVSAGLTGALTVTTIGDDGCAGFQFAIKGTE